MRMAPTSKISPAPSRIRPQPLSETPNSAKVPLAPKRSEIVRIAAPPKPLATIRSATTPSANVPYATDIPLNDSAEHCTRASPQHHPLSFRIPRLGPSRHPIHHPRNRPHEVRTRRQVAQGRTLRHHHRRPAARLHRRLGHHPRQLQQPAGDAGTGVGHAVPGVAHGDGVLRLFKSVEVVQHARTVDDDHPQRQTPVQAAHGGLGAAEGFADAGRRLRQTSRLRLVELDERFFREHHRGGRRARLLRPRGAAGLDLAVAVFDQGFCVAAQFGQRLVVGEHGTG